MAAQKEETLKTLTAMFGDSIDKEIILVVVDTNNGALEPSINALLEISDPTFKSEETAVPVETQSGILTSTTRQQLLLDEELARSLAAEADREAGYPEPIYQRPAYRQQQQQQPHQQSDFNFADELPVIKEKLVNAAETTKKKAIEFYNKLKQQARNESIPTQVHNPQYTNLPKDSGNTVLWADESQYTSPGNNDQKSERSDEKFVSKTFQPSQPRSYSGSSGGGYRLLNSKPEDINALPKGEPIRIIRENSSSSPPPPAAQTSQESPISPYQVSETLVFVPEKPTVETSTSQKRYSLTRASSADAEEIGKEPNKLF